MDTLNGKLTEHGSGQPVHNLRSLEELCGAISKLGCETIEVEQIVGEVQPEVLREAARKLQYLANALEAAGEEAASLARHAAAPSHAAVNKAFSGCWADRLPASGSLCAQFWPAMLVIGSTVPYYICTTYANWFVDEGFAIYRNPDARGETPILDVLQHDFWGTHLNPPEGYNTHKSYRPVITLMYAAEWILAQRYGYGGSEMKPMRALSCCIHSINSLLTLCLLRRLHVPVGWAVICAGFFATHPAHIENIVYLVGRADALGTTFSMLTVLFYLRRTQGRRPSLSFWGYFVLVLLASVAGLCKETCFTILFFLACAELVLRARARHVFGLVFAFAIVAGLRTWYVGGTEAGFGYVDTPIRYQDDRLTRTLSYLHQHAFYAKLLLLPWNQSWDYSFDAFPMVRSFGDVRLLAIVSAYLAVVALAAHGLRVCRRSPVAILGLGLVVIPFVPASNLFFLVGTTVGERLLYPCTVGWALVLASVFPKTLGRRILAPCLLAAYIYNSNVRMSHWKTTQLLFETDAEHWGRSAKVLHAKASELQARSDLEGALSYYLKSLEIFDDQAITDYCIARILINLDRFQEAYERFMKILNGHGIGLHDGNDFLWMTDLGYLSVQLGMYEQGVHYLQEGLQRMPYSCYAWNARGVGLAHMGRLEEALQTLSEGLSCDSEAALIWNNVAVLYAYGSNANEANAALQRALQLNASHPVIVHNAKVLLGQAPAGSKPVFELYIPLPVRR